MFVTGSALPVTDLARACEERGLESLWVPEHPVVPARHETRYPLSDDGKLPRPYTELPDCFATLAAAAGVTRRLRLGTGICLVPERDPLLTAHQVATLDWLSGGRFLFGVGAGWLREEMDLFTPHFPYRFAFMREAVAAMRKLWTEDAPSFEGKWVRFPPAVCRPKPVQRPHPPVIVGGMGPNAMKRVASWGDGWMPIGLPADEVADARRTIEQLARARGRDPDRISVSVMIGAPPGLESSALDLMPSHEVLARYAEAGADRVIVSVPTRTSSRAASSSSSRLRASGEGPAAGRGRGRRRADSPRSVTRDCRARERGHRLRFDSAPLDTGPGATDPCGGRWRHLAQRRRRAGFAFLGGAAAALITRIAVAAVASSPNPKVAVNRRPTTCATRKAMLMPASARPRAIAAPRPGRLSPSTSRHGMSRLSASPACAAAAVARF